jgi:hypothetical protein
MLKVNPTSKKARSHPPVDARSTGVVVACEARVHPRVRVQLDAIVSTLDPVQEDESGERYFVVTGAQTVDVADGGLGLTAESTLAAGGRVVVEVTLQDGLSVERSGRVMWSHRDALGAVSMGIAFDEDLLGLALRAAHEER